MIFKSIVAGAVTVLAVTIVHVLLKGLIPMGQVSLGEILPRLLYDPDYLIIAVASFFFGFYCRLHTPWLK